MQMVLAVFVGEVEVDALFFHQPTDEIEVGLAVLDTVFAFGIAANQFFFDVVEALVAEHLLDDGRDVEILENSAVGGAGQKPQPWP